MRIIILFVLFISLGSLKAQKNVLVFFNDITNKAVQVPKGGMVIVEYQGYLKQLEVNRNTLAQITDSSIVIGKPRLFGGVVEPREIRLGDITGFRKVSVGSQFLRYVLTIGATLGSYYLFSNRDNLTSTERLVYSMGTGLVTTVAINKIFPTRKVKHKLKNGWRMFAM